MRIHRLLLAAGLLVCAAGTASAQDKGKVGFTMGYPAGIGIQWHVSDKVAIRPEFSFSGGTSESQSGTVATEGDNWSFGTQVSVLFYLHTDDRLRTYFAPRFAWSHLNTSSELTAPIVNPLPPGINTEATTTGDGYGASGSFGAQYRVGDRFLVFGELGASYGHASTESSLASASKSTSNSWGTRTAVGIVFFP